MAEEIKRDSGFADALSGFGAVVSDGFETAMGWYSQYLDIQRKKDASGVSELENNGTPYTTTNTQTQPLSPEQLAALGQAQAAADPQSGLIPGVSNTALMFGGVGLLAIVLLTRR